MDKGILNQTLLEKNIERIRGYILDEKDYLNKLGKKFSEVEKNYSSTNTSSLLVKVNSMMQNIDFIYEKRFNYINVLNNTIVKYDELAIVTKQMFDKGVGYDR